MVQEAHVLGIVQAFLFPKARSGKDQVHVSFGAVVGSTLKSVCVCACVHVTVCKLLTFFSLVVIILICSSEDARAILLAAESLRLDTREFVFIILQLLEVGVLDP